MSALERGALAAAMATMVALPTAEIALRQVGSMGIAGSTPIVQHLTLVVGMLGGALAAREGRLLALSPLAGLLSGRAAAAARLLGGAAGAAVAGLLALAAVEFVAVERPAGKVLAYGIPVWVIQAVLPIGFGLIALRLVARSGESRGARLAAAAVAVGVVAVTLRPPVAPEALVVPALVALGLATLCGAPVFATLGGAALVLFRGADLPLASIPLDHYRLVTNPTLPAIPLFTLAGVVLAEGGASRRLVRLLTVLVGRVRGGPALVTTLASAVFTSFTGASGVTILALGGLLMPVLLAARFPERTALGLVTSSGSLGLLLPPCLPLILYAIVARVPMERMFLGGILPGLLLVALTAGWAVRRSPAAKDAAPFDAREALAAARDAKWELLLPVVVGAALFGGFATPVEAAALTALYTFVVEALVHRDLAPLADGWRVAAECGLLVGGILLILGVALGLTNYLVDAEVPARAVEWATTRIGSRFAFLLLLNGFLLVVGCLMDVFSAIVVVAPLVVPIGAAFGVDPVHLGIVFLANLELGYLTPPVGMNLFIASSRFDRPMPEVVRSVAPILAVLLVGLLVITYVPALTTALPNWLAR